MAGFGRTAAGGGEAGASWNRRYLLLAGLAMGFIWYLSDQPGHAVSLPRFSDKGAHLVVYGILGFLLARGVGTGRWWAALVAAICYGAIDETHQSFVPGRNPSPFDLAADALGSAAGVWVASLRRAFRG